MSRNNTDSLLPARVRHNIAEYQLASDWSALCVPVAPAHYLTEVRVAAGPATTSQMVVMHSGNVGLLAGDFIEPLFPSRDLPSYRPVEQAWKYWIQARARKQLAFSRTPEFIDVCYSLISPSKENATSRFDRLADEWMKETRFLSDISEIISHPAYLNIIGMGPFVISLVLNRLKNEDGHWFAALKAITGEDPVPEEDAGRLQKMKEHWLNWGEDHGYLAS